MGPFPWWSRLDGRQADHNWRSQPCNLESQYPLFQGFPNHLLGWFLVVLKPAQEDARRWLALCVGDKAVLTEEYHRDLRQSGALPRFAIPLVIMPGQARPAGLPAADSSPPFGRKLEEFLAAPQLMLLMPINGTRPGRLLGGWGVGGLLPLWLSTTVLSICRLNLLLGRVIRSGCLL